MFSAPVPSATAKDTLVATTSRLWTYPALFKSGLAGTKRTSAKSCGIMTNQFRKATSLPLSHRPCSEATHSGASRLQSI